MKLTGTIKCEIIKPVNDDWNNTGLRLRALRETVAPALTMTMRELYPYAIEVISLIKQKPIKNNDDNDDELKNAIFKAKNDFSGKVEVTLRKFWNTELDRRADFMVKPLVIRRGSLKVKTEVNPNAIKKSCVHVQEYFSSETRHNILSRFTGTSLKDLIASRASIPSWTHGCAFYVRNRECVVSGPASKARIEFPLFNGGKNRTLFAIAPCGKGQEASWNKLVKDYQAQQNRNGAKKADNINKNEMKLGRVGVTYDKKKRKWFFLISWTEERDIKSAGKFQAALNLGVNTFLQAISSKGDDYRVEGTDIIIQRQGFTRRRSSIMKSLNTLGSGSKGHGINRRNLAITKLDKAESRWMTTKCQTVASELIKWCLLHNIGKLILEDLSEIRESDELDSAHVNVKRLIHTWVFAELTSAIQREASEHGVETEIHKCSYNSQKCPQCGFTSEENTKYVERCTGERIDSNGDAWKRVEKKRNFLCVNPKCNFKRDCDVVAAANALTEVTGIEAFKKASKKNSNKLIKKVVNVINSVSI